jgi:hypothetical protein
VERNKSIIDAIINNLHKDENAYIAMFISHHTKNDYVLDELILNAYALFDKHKPATLSKNEISFFDEQVDTIVRAVLPPANATPEKERANRLKVQDEKEQLDDDREKEISREAESDALLMELRRSIKTVEVMGSIVKNRAGSLEKTRLEAIFEEGMKVHLRILSSFFELIKDQDEQQGIVDYISDRLNTIIDEKERRDRETNQQPKPFNRQKIEKLSKTIFWNLNFFVVCGFVDKIVRSLGSNKLIEVIERVCDNQNTPVAFIVKHGILMWYSKNLQIDNIAKRIDEHDVSEIAKRIVKLMIVNHCSMHPIGFRERQKTEKKLGIPSRRLLTKGNEQ